MNIALVDDKQIYLDEMARLCRDFGAENGLDIEVSEYSIVFMNIYMNGSNGVLTAQKLCERDRKNVRVALGDIMSVMTDAHYLDFGLSDGTTLRCRMTIGRFSEMIDDELFILINKGIIVNADYITALENNCCIFENGSQLPIRIRDRIKIEQSVRDYNFNKIRNKQRYNA